MSEISYVPQPSAPASEVHPGSFGRRVLDTFLSPIALFLRFGARPPWVDVTVLTCVIGTVAYALIPTEVWVAAAREALSANPQAQGAAMDPAAMAGVQRIFGIAAAVVMPWLFLPVQAGLLALLFTVFGGGSATFRQYVSVAAHAGLISTLGGLVQLPIVIQTQSLRTGITLAAAVPGLARESFAWQFLNAFNVFLVWSVIVMGVGAATLNRRSPAVPVGVLMGIYAAIAAAMAAL